MIRRQPTVIKLTPEDVIAYDEEKQFQLYSLGSRGAPTQALGNTSSSVNMNQEQLDLNAPLHHHLQPLLNPKPNASYSSLNSSSVGDTDSLLQHQLRRHIKSKDERIGVSRQAQQ
ncbi:CDC26 family anaphase-promoting complex subunit ASCRUDRAFT_72207 [Ascoidea rubescens DSM 1968]|uniref:Uncharacterized protein n=1 Tax=Ascoidea rubescens DSM 1968 TaxID=1344418 RepID=A0A1D2VAS1_9ASCO|nr:hypothetical protein ASCRUDRAFT_72207 [Ascoidea rubescens DSM 1968]ODV58794.1 hypothetical protein ASCRUDRAFT_72207 [Ascoidea rubescens DSM 1968]